MPSKRDREVYTEVRNYFRKLLLLSLFNVVSTNKHINILEHLGIR